MASKNTRSVGPITRSMSPCKAIVDSGQESSTASFVPRIESDPFAIDMNDYLAEIADRQRLVDRSELGGEDILDSLDVTKEHYKRRDRIMAGFLRCLGEECKFLCVCFVIFFIG